MSPEPEIHPPEDRLFVHGKLRPEMFRLGLPHCAAFGDGRRVTVWLYRYDRGLGGVSPIPSGDYLDWVRTQS